MEKPTRTNTPPDLRQPGSPKLGALGSASRFRLRWWLRISLFLNVAAALYFAHTYFAPLDDESLEDAFTALDRDLDLAAAPVPDAQMPVAAPRYVPGMEGGECSLCAVNPALCEELG